MKPTLLLLIIFFAICGLNNKSYTQVVYIPDANFKAALVGNSSINTNGDSEIQTSEAASFAGDLNIIGKNISILTGIEAFTSINSLDCKYNSITSLNVSNNQMLTNLDCSGNNITNINVSGLIYLLSLICEGNDFSSIDISSNTELTTLILSAPILSLDVSKNTKLTTLSLTSHVSSLDISENTSLINLIFTNCYFLSNIDVSLNKELMTLNCSNNKLTSLNVSSNTKLTKLLFYSNNLTTIDVSANTELTVLDCSDNKLTSLDVSTNTKLIKLYCFDNLLTHLNVKNGNNYNFDYFAAYYNTNLDCITVDDSIWSTANWTNIDAGASFSENCYTGISTLTNTSEIKTYPNPATNELNVKSEKLKEERCNLTMFDLFGKDVLSTELTENEQSIDISKLASGVYTIKLITENGIIFNKFVKN